jgi:hypothetical protein
LASLLVGSVFFPVGIAVWMKILSSQMMGVAFPLPGTLIFHRIFSDSLHVVGGSAEGATPVCEGPRHCGQFLSASPLAEAVEIVLATSASEAEQTRRFTFGFIVFGVNALIHEDG